MVSKAAESEGVRDDMQERAQDLLRRITELEEKLVREEGRRPIVSPVPEKPTEEEVREHNVTHTPPKPWCPYCTKAFGLRDPHCRIKKEIFDVDVGLDGVPTIPAPRQAPGIQARELPRSNFGTAGGAIGSVAPS